MAEPDPGRWIKSSDFERVEGSCGHQVQASHWLWPPYGVLANRPDAAGGFGINKPAMPRCFREARSAGRFGPPRHATWRQREGPVFSCSALLLEDKVGR